MIYYKVTDDRDRSMIETEYSVQYLEGVAVDSHHIPRSFYYYLFAFEILYDARKFALFGRRIWKVEGTDRFLHLPWLPEGFSWPKGTIMVRSINLLERVT